ncbi:tungsten formylmethanofuran dehydrogenase subunit E [Candidatus Vecturithrix granuli]|uniref:Tungsten formylmethanofuran dehydrogenase subunit E n=1 Tax=Vecturithrix granuli TaxID=1499967 RepID=A0A0S6W5K2_VECG1|nr:tungsten formylmethanofuran dehydrogenase subunit E [Candidatus Vecturithrix granuli]
MQIGPYSFETFCEKVTEFHGYIAPGVILGGFMVSVGQQFLPADAIYDVICESRKCLPDAVQLLTPCTIGNGWLKILDVGRFALVLYDKNSGAGVRVWVDAEKLGQWPMINDWFFQLTPKSLQNKTELLQQIQAAGTDILNSAKIQIAPEFLRQHKHQGILVCPQCHEPYPVEHGTTCKVCQGFRLPYTLHR